MTQLLSTMDIQVISLLNWVYFQVQSVSFRGCTSIVKETVAALELQVFLHQGTR